MEYTKKIGMIALVVIGTLFVIKLIKPSLPASIASFLP